MTSFSIYNWRILIFKSDLPANAKYIGCYLSTYMNEHGDNCYPSIARICHETCLSKPTVIKYIQVLRDGEWLETKKKGFDGQAWAHNQYYPNIPHKVVKEINQLSEGGKAPLPRRLTSGQKAVKEVNTSSTVNSVVSSTDGHFENFWKTYPKKVKKKDTEKRWKALNLDSLGERIIRDVEARKKNDERWKAGYVPDPTTYLNGERWEDEIEVSRKTERLPTRGDCNAWVKFAASHGITPSTGELQAQFENRVKQHIGTV